MVSPEFQVWCPRNSNRGQYEDAADEFWKWRRGGGVILRGLVRRRETERALFVA